MIHLVPLVSPGQAAIVVLCWFPLEAFACWVNPLSSLIAPIPRSLTVGLFGAMDTSESTIRGPKGFSSQFRSRPFLKSVSQHILAAEIPMAMLVRLQMGAEVSPTFVMALGFSNLNLSASTVATFDPALPTPCILTGAREYSSRSKLHHAMHLVATAGNQFPPVDHRFQKWFAEQNQRCN